MRERRVEWKERKERVWVCGEIGGRGETAERERGVGTAELSIAVRCGALLPLLPLCS